MKSMTGFGTANGEFEGRFLNIELKTVNNRFREIIVRLPKICQGFEEAIKEMLASFIERGRVDFWLQIDEKKVKDSNLKIDFEQTTKILTLLQELKKISNLKDDITLSHLLNYNVITYEDEELDEAAFLNTVLSLSKEAVNNLVEMRTKEGLNLAKDFKKRLKIISLLNDKIKELAKETPNFLYDKINKKISELTDLPNLDEQRLQQEIAYLAEKSDITEENVRLESHIKNFAEICKIKGAVGRKLDFLLQEMGREVNTMGSKAQDINITNSVLALKAELEKIREQIQNIE